MKASLQAQITHHKALHDKTSIPTTILHVHEANHGKSKFIACMDQLQQPSQKLNIMLTICQEYFIAKVEQD